MPRVKISEFKAKEILFPVLGNSYGGVEINCNQNPVAKIKSLDSKKKYVLKVDEGIKKRGKNGLIAINITGSEILFKINELTKKGFAQFLLEEYVPHSGTDEKFLALEQTREGILCHFSKSGGVNVEENADQIKSFIVTPKSLGGIAKELGVKNEFIEKLLVGFEKFYFSFLEINPFIVVDNKVILLDLAVEVDSAASFFVDKSWNEDDFIDSQKNKEKEEFEITKLAGGSPASFKLVVLNTKGSIFTIFSGGGASIVLADEIDNVGKGRELANYAEYSGGPTEEETYIFAKNIISLALRSPAKNKKIYIAGGVANFTDIRATFKGVIRALDEKKDELKTQNIKIYVRRGGPYQEEGLLIMKNFLEKSKLLGEVMGSDRVLTEVITTN